MWGFFFPRDNGGAQAMIDRQTPRQQARPTPQTETATLGGGCFWCLEAVYDEMVGVEDVTSGYAGGTVPHPSYREVCTGTTGHAEVVQIVYDPQRVSYEEILRVFFDIHDPTTLNRQGADVGTQYRSVIFYHDEAQRAIAERMIAELEASSVWARPIVTQVVPLEAFYPAEDYHQEYYARNGQQPYCRLVIAPKLKKFRKLHLSQIKI
jgi:peptide-methionine (S)-S-oxide reductase